MNQSKYYNARTDIQTHTASIHVRMFTFFAFSMQLFTHFQHEKEREYLLFSLRLLLCLCGGDEGRNDAWDDVAFAVVCPGMNTHKNRGCHRGGYDLVYFLNYVENECSPLLKRTKIFSPSTRTTILC